MGVMRGHGLKMFSSAVFKSDYHLLTDAQLTSYHGKLITMFQQMPYGPFEALRLLVGEKKARELAEGSCDIPPFQHAITANVAAGEKKSRYAKKGRKKRKLSEDEECIVLSSD
jgi:hypothetical protein